MKIVELVRLETDEKYGTFGVLKIEKEAFCVTLEPPDRFNEKNRSAIPTGQYLCEKYRSKRFGTTFMIRNVPGRSMVMFHPGNKVDDTEGCPLLAQYFGKLRGDRAVMNSGKTFREFMALMDLEHRFKLTISEAY